MNMNEPMPSQSGVDSSGDLFAKWAAKCPACDSKMPKKTLFVCPDCWWKVPAKDREQLRAMHVRKQCTKSKLASIVRNLKQ